MMASLLSGGEQQMLAIAPGAIVETEAADCSTSRRSGWHRDHRLFRHGGALREEDDGLLVSRRRDKRSRDRRPGGLPGWGTGKDLTSVRRRTWAKTRSFPGVFWVAAHRLDRKNAPLDVKPNRPPASPLVPGVEARLEDRHRPIIQPNPENDGGFPLIAVRDAPDDRIQLRRQEPYD